MAAGEDDLRELARMLTGSRAAAARLVAESAGRRGDDRSGDDPAADDRRRLVQRFLRDGRRSRAAGAPAGSGVDARIAALPAEARAALVLLHAVGLTRTEVAGLLDRSPARLDRMVADATFGLVIPDPELGSALRTWTRPADAGPVPRRRRPALATAVLAGVVLTLLAGAAVLLTGPVRPVPPPPYRRPVGSWSYGFRYLPPPGWAFRQRVLTSTSDELTVAPADRAQSCVLSESLTEGGPDDSFVVGPDAGDPVVPVPVGGAWVTGRSGADVPGTLYWSFRDDTVLQIRCRRPLAVETYAALAGGVTFEPAEVSIPFDLRPTARPGEVRRLTTTASTTTARLVPASLWDGSVQAIDLTAPAAGGPEPAHREVAFRATASADRACVRRLGVLVCAQRTAGTAAAPADRRRARADLTAALVHLTLAPSPSDRSTWFAARDVVPT